MNSLNQIIQRIKLITLSHKQVRSFKHGLVEDFFTEHTALYPAVLLQDNGGSISVQGHRATVNFRMFIMDLVNVAANAKDNELDVQSDMVNVAMDLIAQMNSGVYNDWRVSVDNNLQLVVENDNDLHAGCIVDFSVSIMFKQNICEVPSDLAYEVTPSAMADKLVYDIVYVATGNEGFTLTEDQIPSVIGKKIIIATRSSTPIYPVSNLPGTDEYTWDNTTFTTGSQINAEERFLFVYRNY